MILRAEGDMEGGLRSTSVSYGACSRNLQMGNLKLAEGRDGSRNLVHDTTVEKQYRNYTWTKSDFYSLIF